MIIKKIKTKYFANKEIINYLFFGVVTTVVSLFTYYALVMTILNPKIAWKLQAANILSWIAAVTVAYITNRKYVFESSNKNIKKEISKFISSRIVTLLSDMLIMFIGVTVLNFNDKIFKLFAQIIVVIGNYALSKIFVFKSN